MKNVLAKIIISLVFLMVGFVSFGQSSSERLENRDSDKTFTVKFQKSTYMLLEPITAKLTLLVKINVDCKFREGALVKVKFKDEIKEFYGIASSITSACGGREQLPLSNPVDFSKLVLVDPKTGRPLKIKKQKPLPKVHEIYETIGRASEFFPKSGKYEVQFMHGKMESNTIKVKIEEPVGINKEAFDFLNKYKQYNVPFGWVWEEKNGVVLLEEFVTKYGQSVYGDSAISYLGNIYKARDELEKAQTEFEKIKSSKNKLIADEANKALQDIKVRKAYLLKQEQPQ